MKTKIFRMLSILLAVFLLSATFIGCGLSDEEKALLGVYELIEIEIEGNPTVNAASYSYYLLELKSNGKCLISRKVGGETYDAEASWKINKEGKLEIVTTVGRSKITEIYEIKEDDILLGKNIVMYNGAPTEIIAKFQRPLEEIEV